MSAFHHFLWVIYVLPWRALFCLMPVIAGVYLCVEVLIGARVRLRPLWIVLFCVCLAAIILTTVYGRETGDSAGAGFLPLFYSYKLANENPEMYRTCFMNVLLFFPAGLTLAAALRGRSKAAGGKYSRAAKRIERRPLVICRKFLIPVAVLFCVSLVIELLQMGLGIGVAEWDDVFHNTVGALLGSLAAALGAILKRKYALCRFENEPRI